jgi:hypothetical protein
MLVTSTEFIPRVSILSKVLVQLEDSPYIGLVVLFVLRVDRIQFADGTRWGEERATEECCETSESAFKSGGPNTEIIVGIGCAGICIGCSVVLRKELWEEALRPWTI